MQVSNDQVGAICGHADRNSVTIPGNEIIRMGDAELVLMKYISHLTVPESSLRASGFSTLVLTILAIARAPDTHPH